MSDPSKTDRGPEFFEHDCEICKFTSMATQLRDEKWCQHCGAYFDGKKWIKQHLHSDELENADLLFFEESQLHDKHVFKVQWTVLKAEIYDYWAAKKIDELITSMQERRQAALKVIQESIDQYERDKHTKRDPSVSLEEMEEPPDLEAEHW